MRTLTTEQARRLQSYSPELAELGLGKFLKDLVDEYNTMSKALEGKVVLAISTATAGSAAASVKSRDVMLTLKTVSNGSVHTWFNGTATVAVTKSSTSGTNTGAPITATFVNGVAKVTIPYNGTWAAADTCTLTVSNMTVAGVTVTGGTSVDTLV